MAAPADAAAANFIAMSRLIGGHQTLAAGCVLPVTNVPTLWVPGSSRCFGELANGQQQSGSNSFGQGTIERQPPRERSRNLTPVAVQGASSASIAVDCDARPEHEPGSYQKNKPAADPQPSGNRGVEKMQHG